jgi:Fe-S-cluster containining protein
MTPYEKLDALYATLPTMNCKRMCKAYCGPILISKIEAHRLGEKRGFLDLEPAFKAADRIDLPAPAVIEYEYIGLRTEKIKDGGVGPCVFLEPTFAKCKAYDIRPLVCRLWGCIDHPMMRCPFGCVPTRWVTATEHKQLHLQVIAIQQEWQKEKT